MIASEVHSKIQLQVDGFQSALKHHTGDQEIVASLIKNLQLNMAHIMKIIIRDGDRELSPDEIEILNVKEQLNKD